MHTNPEEFVKKLNKQYNDTVVMRMGDGASASVEVSSTGSIGLDIATGIGGYPRGKIVTIYGDPMSGKTTLALTAAREIQKAGGNILYVDVEHTLNLPYASRIGVDVPNLWITQPDYGEQALRIVEEAVKSETFAMIIIDSVAALAPKKEIEGEIGDAQIGLLARLMSQTCRKLLPGAHSTNTTLMFINQYRANISAMGYNTPTKTTPGGRALDYYSSLILSIARTAYIRRDNEIIGACTKVEIKKNKFAPPYRSAEFDIIYGDGIDTLGEYVAIASSIGILSQSGSWYRYNGNPIGQGKQAAIAFLAENPPVLNEIREQAQKIYGKL